MHACCIGLLRSPSSFLFFQSCVCIWFGLADRSTFMPFHTSAYCFFIPCQAVLPTLHHSHMLYWYIYNSYWWSSWMDCAVVQNWYSLHSFRVLLLGKALLQCVPNTHTFTHALMLTQAHSSTFSQPMHSLCTTLYPHIQYNEWYLCNRV